MRADARQRGRQLVDRVLGHGKRAVAARIAHRELVGRVHLLGDLDAVQKRLAVAQLAAAALVDAEFGVDQLALVADQPVDAVGGHVAALFVRGQREDEVALRPEALALELRQDRHEGGGHRLVVDRAAGGEKAVALLQDEGVRLPIRTQGLDNVQIAEQEQALLATLAPEARDQVALTGERLGALYALLSYTTLPAL